LCVCLEGYYPSVCPEGLGETTWSLILNNLDQVSVCLPTVQV